MSSVCIRLGFSRNAHTFARPKQLFLFFTKLKMEPDFPCLADEIAEPYPDMNIKVAAFTVSKKSINTVCQETFKPLYNYKLLNFNFSLCGSK